MEDDANGVPNPLDSRFRGNDGRRTGMKRNGGHGARKISGHGAMTAHYAHNHPSASVSAPDAISATAHTRSRLNHERRSSAKPTFS